MWSLTRARTQSHLGAVAAKYRAIRESAPKRERSGDPAIRLSEFEANRVSIREAENKAAQPMFRD